MLIALHQQGWAILWCNKEKYPPVKGWQDYQTTEAEIRLKFNQYEHWCTVGGYNDLEILDFDEKHEQGIFERWKSTLSEESAIVLATLPINTTPSGGFHVRYFCDEIEGNQKLCLAPDGKEASIETRGIGGQALIPPSPGYSMIQGSLLDTPRIAVTVRNEFIAKAKACSSVPVTVSSPVSHSPSGKAHQAAGSSYDNDSPGNHYNQTASWADLLLPLGATFVRQVNDVIYVRRPGKTHGISATINYSGTNKLNVFSTAWAPFPGPSGNYNFSSHDLFGAYTLLHHNGDFKAAAQSLKPSTESVIIEEPTNEVTELPYGARTLAGIEPVPIDWLWRGFLARRKLTLWAGVGGVGKSQLAIDTATRVTRGFAWPFEPDQKATQGSVILISAEDDISDTLVPRLLAAGADLEKVIILNEFKTYDEKEKKNVIELVNLSKHLPQIEEIVKKIGDVHLIVIDPILAYMRGKDSNNSQETSEALHAVRQLTDRTNVSTLLITHLNKGGAANANDATGRIMGSQAFVSVVRSAFVIAPIVPPEPEEGESVEPLDGPQQVGMICIKSNNFPLHKIKPLVYTVESVDLPSKTGELIETSVIKWQRQDLELNANDLVQKKGRPSVIADVKRWLWATLNANDREPIDSKEVIDMAMTHRGYSRRSVYNALEELQGKVKVVENPDDKRKVFWTLED